MSLQEKINKDRMQAKLAGCKKHASILTTLKGEIEREYKIATDNEVKAVVKASIKSLKTMLANKRAADMCIVDEEFELEVLQSYMPKVMSLEETQQAVDDAILITNATSMKDIGQVMGALAKHGEVLDKSMASQLVRKHLQ